MCFSARFRRKTLQEGNAMGDTYKRKSHSVYLLTYHVVIVTKYRRECISEEIGEFMKGHASYLAGRFGGEMLSCETDTDHMHMLVSLPPDVKPSEFVRSVKTQLSKEIQKNEVYNAHVGRFLYGEDTPLWSPSYFIATTGDVTMEKVKEYVNSQRTQEHKRKYEKTGRFTKKRRRKN